MTDTANAPERIKAWMQPYFSEIGSWSTTRYPEVTIEYVLATHCDELVAAAYLDTAETIRQLPELMPMNAAQVRAVEYVGNYLTITRTPENARAALTARDERMKAEGAREAQAKIARLTEALTPSEKTKAAYMGEFAITLSEMDEYGDERSRKITVPWDTIKEIMAEIRTRAALTARDERMKAEGAREAQAKIARLTEALMPFSDMAGEMFARNWDASRLVIALDNPEQINRVYVTDFFAARKAIQENTDG